LFRKLLIANRGEIACRVIATAHRMEIATVAVYSDADRDALHVLQADSAERVGPAEAALSYLNIEAVIDAARRSGAEAIHPGYGFLSENPDFVEAVEAAGLIFVGPPSGAIRAMGLKDAAKQLMEKAGVPVVPGYHGQAQETVVLAAKATEIGYPVLIKARAGGGGKGMRRVDKPADFSDALAGARREAKAAFGDDRVLVEKLIEKPRHIEVQVFGDTHGNIVHLYERDCSLQRRHQKVIEEAPAPGMHAEMRMAMTEAAVDAARAIGYAGAGTVEFIVDASEGLSTDRFWFMEMNTRLQVEHPVTEMITGLDLVEWQLRVAAGEKLPLRQEEIAFSGHSFEARIYAEDVEKGFLPAVGTLHFLEFPPNARVDSGIRQGDRIQPYYDPMIAKLIVGGTDRGEALDRLSSALAATRIAGLVTNVPFLNRLARNDAFGSGEVETGLIARNLDNLAIDPPDDTIRCAAAVAALGLHRESPDREPAERIGSWGLWTVPASYVDLRYRGEDAAVRIAPASGGGWAVAMGERQIILRMEEIGESEVEIVTAQGRARFGLARWPGHVTVFSDGAAYDFAVSGAGSTDGGTSVSGNVVAAPMPGLVKLVRASAGERVSSGTPLIVLEAMKMEYTLGAPRDGRLQAVHVREGQQVAEGVLLVTLEPEAAE
jgi:3-methylcrotonyl-CoA carboxylase alpha subunit